MAIARGPNIVRDNLVFALDAASERSYPGSGTSLYDLSSNARDFTLKNGASISNGNTVLDGSNDYVELVETFDWTATPWTVEFWANPTDFTYPTVIDLISAGNGHFRFVIGSSGIYSTFRTPGGSSTTLISYSTSITFNNWYHCVFTRSGNTYKAYLNGNLGATNTTAALNNNAQMTVIRIGYSADYDASDRTFEGSVGPVRMYYRALADAEVTQNFDAHKNRFNL